MPIAFVLLWLIGLYLRHAFNPRDSKADPSSVPAWREIRVSGSFRWLFGYKPTDGPVSVASFVTQLPALLGLATSIVLSLFGSASTVVPTLILIAVLVISLPLSLSLADRIWHSQRKNTSADNSSH